MLDEGEVAFAITIPVNFARDLVRGESPQLLIQADASDPAASSIALATIADLGKSALKDDLIGPLASRGEQARLHHGDPSPLQPRRHHAIQHRAGINRGHPHHDHGDGHRDGDDAGAREGDVRESARDAGGPFEVMIGKITPYVVVGYIQAGLILLGAYFVFNVPMIGSLTLLAGTAGLFIAANLALGFTFSTIATNQLQAMQMTVFFLLPSILLSGFMFPFRGMPNWAQWAGEALPNTHFLRIVRGILLKGNGPAEIWPSVWPLLIFLFVVGSVALVRYRRTLD